ncbi:hypothetical protein BCR44DRAFT_1425961 [Catenaria anguillulae PL171]|uniref:Uncharacterized protein n=1 Tax=Catenaria anguillulae PL171 TaxID=765915 RepID=A0A1Y2HZE6_9FUNG|nr:hypothetical protein BCR44DRAFT_1425961 [Catenaria anguillulae PL171]
MLAALCNLAPPDLLHLFSLSKHPPSTQPFLVKSPSFQQPLSCRLRQSSPQTLPLTLKMTALLTRPPCTSLLPSLHWKSQQHCRPTRPNPAAMHPNSNATRSAAGQSRRAQKCNGQRRRPARRVAEWKWIRATGTTEGRAVWLRPSIT